MQGVALVGIGPWVIVVGAMVDWVPPCESSRASAMSSKSISSSSGAGFEFLPTARAAGTRIASPLYWLPSFVAPLGLSSVAGLGPVSGSGALNILWV